MCISYLCVMRFETYTLKTTDVLVISTIVIIVIYINYYISS